MCCKQNIGYFAVRGSKYHFGMRKDWAKGVLGGQEFRINLGRLSAIWMRYEETFASLRYLEYYIDLEHHYRQKFSFFVPWLRKDGSQLQSTNKFGCAYADLSVDPRARSRIVHEAEVPILWGCTTAGLDFLVNKGPFGHSLRDLEPIRRLDDLLQETYYWQAR